MFSQLPDQAFEFMEWPWSQIESFFQELLETPLNRKNLDGWLKQWSHLYLLFKETQFRLELETTRDTTDQLAEQRYKHFLDEIYPRFNGSNQIIKDKFLAYGIEPSGFDIALRNMRAEVELFREENLPLLSDELNLATEYDKISGAQTVIWEGEEVTIPQLQPAYLDPDRDRREQAWRLAADRWLQDREAINNLWEKFMNLRGELAVNAGLPDYRAYRWRQLLRFDYTPADCAHFREAIAAVAVPAAQRLYEKRRKKLGVANLRPWDLQVDPAGRPPLRPFREAAELENKSAAIFHKVEAQLGEYFEIMRAEGLLDLENRKGKGPGAFCTSFPVAKRPFIFMNAVGLHEDVLTLFHESGHAFHVFEINPLQYHQQREVPMEFAEVASMAMEFLASPYLGQDEGGFYGDEEASRARVEHLENDILFWPYMAVVDGFQHWVYENHAAATDPTNCDAKWAELWERFMVGVDWSGLEQAMQTGWQRKLHIHQLPFYYVEYGLAQMGAVQVWKNSLSDRAAAVANYQHALSLGGTVTLPQLYSAAGARLAFDANTLRQVVDFMEKTIAELEG
jgi:oligoendopeptidase F